MAESVAALLTPADPLLRSPAPERVHYATGVLLQAEDFQDEQTYHRSRLAAVLSHLVGHGTLAGLAVRAPAADDDGDLHLRVEPGLAIDRYGRIIEVTQSWCTRLARWYAGQETQELRAAITRTADAAMPVAVVADLFVAMADCGRGKTPSFASGPFDALDALVPARLAETPAFKLVLRQEQPRSSIPVPENSWPDAGGANAKLAAVLGSYRPGAGKGANGALGDMPEHVAGEDPSAVLLARIAIPVQLAADAPSSARPQLDQSKRVHVDNRLRPFIALPGKWLGAAPTPVALQEP